MDTGGQFYFRGVPSPCPTSQRSSDSEYCFLRRFVWFHNIDRVQERCKLVQVGRDEGVFF